MAGLPEEGAPRWRGAVSQGGDERECGTIGDSEKTCQDVQYRDVQALCVVMLRFDAWVGISHGDVW